MGMTLTQLLYIDFTEQSDQHVFSEAKLEELVQKISEHSTPTKSGLVLEAEEKGQPPKVPSPTPDVEQPAPAKTTPSQEEQQSAKKSPKKQEKSKSPKKKSSKTNSAENSPKKVKSKACCIF